jgi:hypothetical protein
LALGLRRRRFLGFESGCGGQNQAATDQDEEKTTTVERHYLKDSYDPLFYESWKGWATLLAQ